MFHVFSVAVLVAVQASGQAPEALKPFELISKRPMTLSVSHTFEREEAKRRVSYLLEYWDKRFAVRSLWQGDRVYITGKIYGMDIRAYFDVESERVAAKAEDPGFFMRGTTSDYVEKKLKKYLSLDYRDF